MHSINRAELDLPMLPLSARTTHIFPNLASASLLSVGQLCDAGCTAFFNKTKLYIFFNGKIILQVQDNQLTFGRLMPINHYRPHHITIILSIQPLTNQQSRNVLNFIMHHYSHQLLIPYKKLSKLVILCLFLGSLTNNYANIYLQQLQQTKVIYMPNVAIFNQLNENPTVNFICIMPLFHHQQEQPIINKARLAQENERTHFIFPACLPITGQIFTDQTG